MNPYLHKIDIGFSESNSTVEAIEREIFFPKKQLFHLTTTVQDRDTGRSSEQNEEFILLCISCLTIILQHVFCCALSI